MKKLFQHKKKNSADFPVTLKPNRPEGVPLVEADYKTGLSLEDVQLRLNYGLKNTSTPSLTRSKRQIYISNICTLFNLINVVLAVLLIIAGHILNALFVGIAVVNTAIGIFQELRAKKTIDQLSIVARSRVTVVRNGKEKSIEQDDLVLDDIIHLKSGDQVCSDGVLIHSEGMELDESLLTGEADTIQKRDGDSLFSGSAITAGSGYIRITAVGDQGYAAKLSLEAKQEKPHSSELLKMLNRIIQVLTIIIIPLGIALFYFKMGQLNDWSEVIKQVSTAMIGMIPEGLMLLTSVAFAVGSINLARKKTLVQSMTSIETLARVDTLCLDKTGTITDGTMKLEKTITLSDFSENTSTVSTVLSALLSTLQDENATASTLRRQFKEKVDWKSTQIVPFSSKRKWSGASFEDHGTFTMGAPEFIISNDNMDENLKNQVEEAAEQGLRTLLIAHSSEPFGENNELPLQLSPIALLLLSDNIRREAPSTFRYFEEEGVTLKVISGDNPITVSNIAKRAGITDTAHYVDMSTIPEGTDLREIAETNRVFGRVSPYQKRELIRAMQANGHITCMTGDGVNDVLALRESNCSVAMVGGSSAARSVSDFVLLSSDFSNMIEVLKEGRRVINNIEEVASLYLVKTIYSMIFAILYMIIPYPLPYDTRQIGPVNSLTVGIPSFFLALAPNYGRPKGRFLANVLENSLPTALSIVFGILMTQTFGLYFGLSNKSISTIAVLTIGTMGFMLLFKISKSITLTRILLFTALIIAFILCFFGLPGELFNLGSLLSKDMSFYIPLLLACCFLFDQLSKIVIFVENKLQDLKIKQKNKHLNKKYY